MTAVSLSTEVYLRYTFLTTLFFLAVYIKIMKQFKDAERKEKMLFFAWKEKIFNNDDVDERARK